MNWIKKHFKQIIYISFLFPIILVAFVSISHVTKWYAIGNPISWAIYLSVAVEVAALSSLAAIVGKMGKKVYFPFLLVTLIQLIGNVFFSYQYIKIDNQVFLDWVELVNPLFSLWVEPTDLIAHKRIVSFLLGGLLPVISLTFLGLLVKFEETDWESENTTTPLTSDNKENEPLTGEKSPPINPSDLMSEISKIRLSDSEMSRLEDVLSKIKPINNIKDIPVEVPNDDHLFSTEHSIDNISDNQPQQTSIKFDQEYDEYNIFPAISDEETNKMVLDEWERKNVDDSEEDYDELTDKEQIELTGEEPLPNSISDNFKEETINRWKRLGLLDGDLESIPDLPTIPIEIMYPNYTQQTSNDESSSTPKEINLETKTKTIESEIVTTDTTITRPTDEEVHESFKEQMDFETKQMTENEKDELTKEIDNELKKKSQT